LGGEDHALLACVHHAVSDGWSTGILLRELSALYEGAPLPELEVQYADFAVWQRAWLSGETLERQLAWWTERLRSAPPVLELPTDRPRTVGRPSSAGMERIALAPETTGALRGLAAAEGATLFMVLLAAWQALLGRWAGQDDVVVGSPIAGRTRVETEGLIGFFVNTLALRGDLSGDPAFRELLGRVRETALGAYAHQELPFERLVEALGVERSLTHAPLFQAAFALQNLDGGTLRLGGVRAAGIPVRTQSARFDLSLGFVERDGGLAGWMEYDAGLFDAETVRLMGDHLAVLLERAAADPAAPLSALGAVSEEERRRLLGEWNDTARELPAVLAHEAFAARVVEAPHAVALRFEGEQVTYGELDRRASALAARLRARGVGPEVPVALFLERGVEMLAAVLAILRSGGVYVPLDPDHPSARLGLVLEDVAPRLVLTHSALAARLPAGHETLLVDAETGDAPADADLPRVSPENLAYVIYTSGSTGRPKGVQVTHDSLAKLLLGAQDAFGFRAGDVMPCLASYAFDIWAFEALLPLAAGATVHLFPRERVLDVEALAADLHDATALHAVPALMRQVAAALRASGATLPRLRAAFVGGDAVPPDLLGEMRAAFPAAGLHVLYGPTEATVLAASFPVSPERAVARQMLGKPLPDARLYVCDGRGDLLPAGIPGELWIGGAGVARDYLGRPELTADRFVPDPFAAAPGARAYRTGDRARWLPDGALEFLGRVDRQVKIRGFRIEPGEVESALAAHPQVREAVAVVREDAPGERRLVAYVEALPGARPAPGELRAWAQGRVPEYMVPAAFVVLDRIPLTPTGKLDRGALPAPPDAGSADGGGDAPRTPTEEVLAGIWAELLGAAAVGRGDDFFALGGHSLLATRAVSRIRTAFATELPVRALFEAPTLAALAARVDAAVRAGQGMEMPPLVRAPDGAEAPLSFAQQRLWFIDQVDPGSATYNIAVPLRLDGALDPRRLSRALSALV
ncbi:MAG TPA: amino acid adenylation domain-containing protein, partial [Longimicrobiaceae bacterium]|nr:amino acid adenylation domain-containing protein [Longimicrobiaceae bacterium]